MRGARSAAVAAVLLNLVFVHAPSQAQSDYPNKPITLMLPLGAGGAMDILARGHFAPRLSERLGKPVVIENRTGGGTVIAATAVAKSPPDGYTLFFVPAGTLTTNAALYKSLPYDPGKDFVPIALTSKLGFVLSVNPATPVKTVAELVAYVKERPGQLSYGSTGIGATPHLAVEMFQRAAGLKMNHVPYRGMPQATNDVVAGHTQLVFTDPPMAQTLSADNKLRPLAVSTLERIPAIQNVPALSELGYKDFEAVSWHMIVAPAGTPKPVVDRLHAEFKAIVASPQFQQQALKMGLNAIDSPPPDALKRYLDAEIVRWGELVKQVGIAGSQ
jgi:tripartite-type tricarboxylate transporter receptor subunit TctC